ncbi:MAG: glycosyltransferase family 39 protein, partial [Candidatus Omnitrophota bacterium]
MLILVILLVAGIFRSHNLKLYDLTFDELGTDMYSFQSVNKVARLSGQGPFTVIFEQMRNDPHSPLYYLTVYFFSKYWGDGITLRFLSVIFSLSVCLLFFYFSTLFLNFRGSVLALGLLAIHPLHIWYAQEARMYALVCFFVLLMATVYMLALRADKFRYWILFLVTGVVALVASYFSFFLLIGTGLILLIPDNRRYWRKWAFSVIGMFITLLLLRPIFLSQFNFVKHSFWIPQPSFMTLFLSQMIFNQGFSATCFQYFLGLVIFSSIFVLGLLTLFFSDQKKSFILVIFIAVPLFLAYYISKYYVPIYIHRQLMIFSPFYYLGIAQGLEKIMSRRFGILILLIAITLLLGSLQNYYNGYMFSHPFRADLFGGVYPKKRYLTLFTSLEHSFLQKDWLIAGDLQSYILLRSYLDKRAAEGSLSPDQLSFVFTPQYVFQYDQRYMGIDAVIKALPAQKLSSLYS